MALRTPSYALLACTHEGGRRGADASDRRVGKGLGSGLRCEPIELEVVLIGAEVGVGVTAGRGPAVTDV